MRLMKYGPNGEEIEVEELWFDGYFIGERQLEGLPIRIRLDSSKGVRATAAWPKGQSKMFWAARATEYALYNDVFSTSEDLLDDDGFIDFEGEPQDVIPVPKQFDVSSSQDVIRALLKGK